MNLGTLTSDLASRVRTPAIERYAEGLGWTRVPGIHGSIAVYQRPDSPLHQLIVPLDESYDDYGETVIEAVRKLAAFEKKSPAEVLRLLLSPPSDVLTFQEVGGSSSDPDGPSLDHAASVLEGIRRSLLAVAIHVLQGRRDPGLPPLSTAEQFVSRCRLGFGESGPAVFRVICPIEEASGNQKAAPPLGRKVTQGFFGLVKSLVTAIEGRSFRALANLLNDPAFDADLLRGLAMLRPSDPKARLLIVADWSREVARPVPGPTDSIEIPWDDFALLERFSQGSWKSAAFDVSPVPKSWN